MYCLMIMKYTNKQKMVLSRDIQWVRGHSPSRMFYYPFLLWKPGREKLIEDNILIAIIIV